MLGGAADLRDLRYLRIADGLLNNITGANGTLGLDKLMNQVTNRTGKFDLSLKNASAAFNITGLAEIAIGVDDVALDGLTSWKEIKLIEPIGTSRIYFVPIHVLVPAPHSPPTPQAVPPVPTRPTRLGLTCRTTNS